MKKKISVFLLILLLAVTVLPAKNQFELKMNLSNILNLLLNGGDITSSSFGNKDSTLNPADRDSGSFYLGLPRFTYYFTDEHGLAANMYFNVSTTTGVGNSEFSSLIAYSYRMDLPLEKVEMVVTPGLRWTVMGAKSPEGNAHDSMLSLETDLDFRYNFTPNFFMSIGLLNNMEFMTIEKVNAGNEKTSESYFYFQNKANIPNVAIGFTF